VRFRRRWRGFPLNVQLCRFHHRQAHEGKVEIQRLDDGALRLLKPNGESFDSVAPDHARPLADWRQGCERSRALIPSPQAAHRSTGCLISIARCRSRLSGVSTLPRAK
jgi:hypothetical protein